MLHADRVQMTGWPGINVIHSIMLNEVKRRRTGEGPAFYVLKMFIRLTTARARNGRPAPWVTRPSTGRRHFPVLSAGTSADTQGHVNISLANVDVVNSRAIQNHAEEQPVLLTSPRPRSHHRSRQDSYNDFAQPEVVNIKALDASACSYTGKTIRVTLHRRGRNAVLSQGLARPEKRFGRFSAVLLCGCNHSNVTRIVSRIPSRRRRPVP